MPVLARDGITLECDYRKLGAGCDEIRSLIKID